MISIGGVIGQGTISLCNSTIHARSLTTSIIVQVYFCRLVPILLKQVIFPEDTSNLKQADRNKTSCIGPAGLLVAYAIIGFVVYWVAVELGEVAAYIPVSISSF